MKTIIVSTAEHIDQALKDEGLTPSPAPEDAFWTVTTREETVRFVVLDRLMQRVADKINSADVDQCEHLIGALIQFAERTSEPHQSIGFVEALVRFVEGTSEFDQHVDIEETIIRFIEKESK